ncbi:MAG TPA: hypothetical protein VHZ74_10610 [Bryobacteraceae bacterium]|jgi:hypothetical protein|nr:hypothetical protein [Bryobacteraceae bacterium]
MPMGDLILNHREMRMLQALLDKLNEHIEASIESVTIGDALYPPAYATDRNEVEAVRRDRRLRRRSEDLLIRIDTALGEEQREGVKA